MITAQEYKFKIATEPWEFEQINRLNYQTFVEEIPQHQPNVDEILVDKFHDENTYLICVSENNILGMLTIRSNRPFSLDKKVENLESYLPRYRSICEVRLLAARKTHRHKRVAHGLITEAVKYCLRNGHDIAVISALVAQQKLYEHIGFVAFGPIVGNGQAQFQPMYLTTKAYYERSKKPIPIKEIVPHPSPVISLMPGPVEISDEVKKAFILNEISHRSKEFAAIHKQTKELLCRLVNTKHVEIFMGSGTLANDVIAGQLSLTHQKGLILSNGEFGTRLIKAARRFLLDFENICFEWAQPFDNQKIKKVLSEDSDIKWLWVVHCETSTGMLNDLDMLREICADYNLRLCIDCVSTIGTVPLDLSDIYLASAVSGKAIESYAGLSMVFYNHQLDPQQDSLPSYLDLSVYARAEVVPYTVCTGLVYALNTALKRLNVEKKYRSVKTLSQWLRTELAEMGREPLVKEEFSCPGVITLHLDDNFNSKQIGDSLKDNGFAISYASSYLLQRNWIQVCLMTEIPQTSLELFVGHLRRALSRR